MNRDDQPFLGASGYGTAQYGKPSFTRPGSQDPTFVSLPQSELQRLLQIESAALAAYQEMSGARIERRSFIDVTNALDVALHMPVFGG
jgi:hypothetical protein